MGQRMTCDGAIAAFHIVFDMIGKCRHIVWSLLTSRIVIKEQVTSIRQGLLTVHEIANALDALSDVQELRFFGRDEIQLRPSSTRSSVHWGCMD
jgi:hypothetical protein